jgi:hypothetical protein
VRYKQVEEVLAEIFEIEPDRHKAFRARLRHLRNIGIPADLPKPGSGAQVDYSRDHVLEMLIALEITSIGIAPRHTTYLTRMLRVGEMFASVLEKDNEFYLIIYQDEDEPIFKIDQLNDQGILQSVNGHRRISFVKLSSSLRMLDQHFKKLAETALC